jgi:hypothetical protein
VLPSASPCLADKSGAGAALTVYHGATSGTTAPVATPRLSGLLAGLGLNTVVPPNLPAPGQQLPVMDPDQGLISAPMQLGSGSGWKLYLVWSRPNWRQNSTASSPLLTIGSTVMLSADNTAGSNQLLLFPGTQQTVLTTALTRRQSSVAFPLPHRSVRGGWTFDKVVQRTRHCRRRAAVRPA